jgi:hypothetical protein
VFDRSIDQVGAVKDVGGVIDFAIKQTPPRLWLDVKIAAAI